MFKKLQEGKVYQFLFLLWLLTLPFGAKVGHLSLGVVTIYPNLICSLALVSTAVFSFNQWKKAFKIISFFLLAWLIYAVLFAILKVKNADVIFDIRSLIMQLIFAMVLFSSYTILGQEKFMKMLVVGFRCFLLILLLFGFYEFYTGNHFLGTTTAKYKFLMVGVVFYAPTFIYDNPNDYMLYACFVLSFLAIFDAELRERPFRIISITLVLMVYNSSVLSRLAFLIFFVIIGIQLFDFFWSKRKKINPMMLGSLTFSALMAIALIVSTPVFYGPKYDTGENIYQYNDIRVVHKSGDSVKEIIAFQHLTIEEQDQIKEFTETSSVLYFKDEDAVRTIASSDSLAVLKNMAVAEGVAADQVRINLIKNGFEIAKDNPFLGIGPGQFRHLHREKKVTHLTGTVISPHNFVVEIISQYGVFAWGYLGAILFFFIHFIRTRKTRAQNLNKTLLSLFICVPLFWLMPSAYLYLDINWLLLPMLSILLVNSDILTDGK